jgi:hypothetical protein
MRHWGYRILAVLLLFLTCAYSATACESGHWVQEVAGEGKIVILEDGSVWEIGGGDEIDTALWLPITDITACSDKLINTEDGEVADARRIR